ncbi:MAG: p16 [Bacillus sp. (in: firmicutes)]|nr:p16 [Bacillus sp. (in: firmicutes)]
MSIIIEALDGTPYDLGGMGLIPLALRVESLSPRTISELIDGRDGHVDLETTFEGRSLKAFFKLQGNDSTDYTLIRNLVYKLFDGKTYFYVIDEKEKGKRWKVKSAAKYDLERINPNTGRFEIDFISPSPYAESIGTTLDSLTFDEEKWQIGQGLNEEPLVYIHNSSTFSVFNAGDIAIDPRKAPLKITYKGASNNLAIKNNTTGDEWSYTGLSVVEDAVELDGIRSLKNGQSIFGQTNYKLITIAPGWNDFIITGASDPFEVTFDFRFYYI